MLVLAQALSRPPLQRLFVLSRGQRLDPALGSWNDHLTARTHRTRKKPVEPFCRKIRQVAGHDQIPWRARFGQSGGNPCQGSAAGSAWPWLDLRVVWYRAQSEVRVSASRSDNCDFGDKRFEQSSCVKDQRDPSEIETPLVAAHARARAPRENETSDLAMAFHDCAAILRPHAELAQRSGEL
jgi:hypothetical protein